MASSSAQNQPLLSGTPKSKPSRFRFLRFVLPIIALAAICLYFIPFGDPPLSPHNVCIPAHDPASCSALVSESFRGKPMDGRDLLLAFLEVSTPYVRNAIQAATDLGRRINDAREKSAVDDCVQLMELSLDRITASMETLNRTGRSSNPDAHTWLSSALTNYATCLDSLNRLARPVLAIRLQDLIGRGRAALAVLVSTTTTSKPNLDLTRVMDFPSWVTGRDRRLLEATVKDIKANVVVATDGSGRFKTVKEAIASAPDNGKARYVIYVKRGTYKENVEVGKKKTNVMLVGDGIDVTVITGNLNVVDGATTFNSATLAAVGDGFIAQDMTFQNTAGAAKHQAVALRVGADQSVINRCRMDAYQDTLYTHSNRQFFRDSQVTGTVDFIFGNAAVVFQNCHLVARKPMANQNNMVTAQGRMDPNQNTGTSIQSCTIAPSADLGPVKGSIKTYLGRPWKEYSRTVVMQSNIGDHVDPSGWAEWSGDFALKTLYYGEYLNFGPGSGTGKRVKWPGYHIMNMAEARKFTVAELIQGGAWLKSTGVSFSEGL